MNERRDFMFRLLKREIRAFWSSRNNEILTAMIIILVGIGSFGIGRLSVLEEQKGQEAGVLSANRVLEGGEDIGEPKNNNFSTLKPGGQVVASKTGSKYHLPWCSGAKTIKEENKIWFDSYQAARAAGYLPAGNCKGIE